MFSNDESSDSEGIVSSRHDFATGNRVLDLDFDLLNKNVEFDGWNFVLFLIVDLLVDFIRLYFRQQMNVPQCLSLITITLEH